MRASRPVKFSRHKTNSKPVNHKHGLRSKSAKKEELLASNANEVSPFLNLPMELKIQIAKHLAVKDLVNLRLISKQWAASGAIRLFPKGMSLRPHRDDMTRLEAVSKHPEIAKGIKHLEIYAGDMDFEQFSCSMNRDSYLTRKKARDLILSIYRPEQLTRHGDEEILARMLPKLPALRSISISSVKFPFWDIDNDLDDVWAGMQDECDEFDMSHCYTSAISRRRFAGTLSAIVKSRAVIDTLELDLMPVDCFLISDMAQEHQLDEAPESFEDLQRRLYREVGNQLPGTAIVTIDADLGQALSHITTLCMGWIGSGLAGIHLYTDLDLARRMASFIGAFVNLKSLDISYGVEEDQTEDFLEAWQRGFFELKFSHLERLRLKEMESQEAQLLKFLTQHSSTLKCLQIEEDDTEIAVERTTKDLLTDLREKLNLEKFEYLDYRFERIYDDNWSPIKYPSDMRRLVTNAKLLEFYVTKKCPWPMADDEPRPRGWKRKFVGSDLAFLELSEAERADLLGDDWETEGESDEDEEEDEDDTDEDDSMDDFDDDNDEDMDDEDGGGHGHGNYFMPMSLLMHLGIFGDHLPPGHTWQHHSEVNQDEDQDEEDDEEMPDLIE